jgi:hypothetical protein
VKIWTVLRQPRCSNYAVDAPCKEDGNNAYDEVELQGQIVDIRPCNTGDQDDDDDGGGGIMANRRPGTS